MLKILLITLLTFSLHAGAQMKHVYDFSVKDIHGKTQSLSQYKGKVLLIVNVASECGFTKQYTGLETLYKNYKAKGFEILAFPCNQFGGQEPGSAEEIQNFCSRNFSVTFPLFAKIDVNGDKADPLYVFLKKEASGFLGSTSIKWNFTKFLINKEGKVLERYGSSTKPSEIAKDIEKLLQ